MKIFETTTLQRWGTNRPTSFHPSQGTLKHIKCTERTFLKLYNLMFCVAAVTRLDERLCRKGRRNETPWLLCVWLILWRAAIKGSAEKRQRKRDLPPKLRRSATDRDGSLPFRPLLWMIINGAAFQRCTVACWVGGEAPHPSLLTSAFIWLAPYEAPSSQLAAEEVKEKGGVKAEEEMEEKRILEDEKEEGGLMSRQSCAEMRNQLINQNQWFLSPAGHHPPKTFLTSHQPDSV